VSMSAQTIFRWDSTRQRLPQVTESCDPFAEIRHWGIVRGIPVRSRSVVVSFFRGLQSPLRDLAGNVPGLAAFGNNTG